MRTRFRDRARGTPRCPYCRENLSRDQTSARCASCGTLFHAPCAAELGGCSTLGCAGQRLQPVAAESQQGKGADAPGALEVLGQLMVAGGVFGSVLLVASLVLIALTVVYFGGWSLLVEVADELPAHLGQFKALTACLLAFPTLCALGLLLFAARRWGESR